MLAISKNTATVGVSHASIAILGVLDEFFDTVDEPDVGLDSKLCALDQELTHVAFQYEA